jgi:hypothetical protein
MGLPKVETHLHTGKALTHDHCHSVNHIRNLQIPGS